MTYSELSWEIAQLSYRDKFRLAQLLIQLARKEEEERNPQQRQKHGPSAKLDPELVQHVADRHRSLKPSKKKALLNSVHTAYSVQGVSGGRWQRIRVPLVFHIRLQIFNRRFEYFVAAGDEAATGEGPRWMTVLSASLH